MKWIIPCNPNKYDVFRAYYESDEVDWRMKGYKYHVGDTIYIYLSRPYSKIMFKCRVIKIDIPFSESIDDAKYWGDKPENLETSKYARLKLIKAFDDEKVSLDNLLKQGLSMAPLGPMTLRSYQELDDYLDNYEGDFNNLEIINYIDYSWNEYASSVWDILVELVEQGQTIFYSDLTAKFNKHHRTARYMLEPIQAYCINNNLPVLTAIVISKGAEKPGHGFIPGDYQAEMIKVFDYDWRGVDNPFIVKRRPLQKGFDKQKTSSHIVYKEALGKHRVGQGVFRDILLKKYNSKCCLCSVSGKEFLLASHIKPWNECELGEHLDPNNGLLLCPNHDKLFDKHLISFDNEGKIIISTKLDEINRVFLNVNEGMSIIINDKIEEFMKLHRERIVGNQYED